MNFATRFIAALLAPAMAALAAAPPPDPLRGATRRNRRRVLQGLGGGLTVRRGRIEIPDGVKLVGGKGLR